MTETKTTQISRDSDKVDRVSSSLSSIYTQNLPDILTQLGISLAISTYQAGKIILVRAENGIITTEFQNFDKPMGIAVHKDRLTIGGQNSVWYYQNMPELDAGFSPEGDYDTSYLPRKIHITGDIDIHEMAWGQAGLWVVNTKFGSLCTLDSNHNFTPHWRPHFLTASSPEDRCHLNGLAMGNGQPKYVTALGETNTAGGWRNNKRDGGIVMDVETNHILARGLSMPHSPRLYNGKLWLLESGEGRLGWYDPNGLTNGGYAYNTLETVAKLPGFTRGLDFAGSLAFIGLSQVRNSAVFSGIPLMERTEERASGVWVVDIYTGETVAFLRFEGDIQEIFAVQVLRTSTPQILEVADYIVPVQKSSVDTTFTVKKHVV